MALYQVLITHYKVLKEGKLKILILEAIRKVYQINRLHQTITMIIGRDLT